MGFAPISACWPARRAGESHWKARLSDAQVEAMRILHEDEGWGYRRLARHFDVPKATVQAICKYRRR